MQNRRSFLKTLGAGAVMFAAPPVLRAQEKAARPNIIMILADDMGWSDIGCYGGEVKTPNLDRLAKQGVRFTQFHNTAKCFPSRACLLTGVYAQQCGMDRGPVGYTNSVSLGDVLRTAGYRTLAAGKHHSTDSLYDMGFDRYFGLRDGACNYFNPGKQREGEEKPAQKNNHRAWCIDEKVYKPYTPPEKDFYTTDYFTKYALQYLDEYGEDDKPFFLYLAFNAPHDPLMAWPEDIAKYEGRYDAGWEKLREERFARQKEMGLVDKNSPLSEPTFKPWNSLSAEEKKIESRKMTVYSAMIDRMDQNIGKVLRKVRSLGKSQETLILFASDNGCSAEVVRLKGGTGEIGEMTNWASIGGNWANASNTPYRYFKNYSHEGGICTPLIACWPEGMKGEKGRITQWTGHFIDIMATLVEVSGATYPKTHKGQAVAPMAGESFLSVLKGDETPRTKPIFWQWSKGKAVRDGKWKAVQWGGDKDWEIYDMDADRTETHNLAEKEEKRLEEMKTKHKKWIAACKVKSEK